MLIFGLKRLTKETNSLFIQLFNPSNIPKQYFSNPSICLDNCETKLILRIHFVASRTLIVNIILKNHFSDVSKSFLERYSL